MKKTPWYSYTFLAGLVLGVLALSSEIDGATRAYMLGAAGALMLPAFARWK